MSRAAWAAFDGLCVHANVPDNDHWDMGAANLARIAAAARGETEDDDMTPEDQKRLRRVETLLDYLVPRTPVRVSTSGANIGQADPNGELVSDVWRWTLGMELERQGRSTELADRIAAQVVAALPQNPGGGASPKEVEQAVRNVLLSGAAPGG